MVFVTVCTHEQQFNRLLQAVDSWAENREETVVVQTGYSTYNLVHCISEKFFPYNEMMDYVQKARIVICHGGPASFIMPLQYGKVPVVVPRQVKYEEHVNNHQLDFCKEVEHRMGNIIVVEEISDLTDILDKYSGIINDKDKQLSSNNELFCKNFSIVVDELLKNRGSQI